MTVTSMTSTLLNDAQHVFHLKKKGDLGVVMDKNYYYSFILIHVLASVALKPIFSHLNK